MVLCYVMSATVLFVQSCIAAEPATVNSSTVERWDIFEVSLKGPEDGNPFVDVELTAEFASGGKTVQVTGFYDGDGTYRIRFMPDKLGKCKYATKSNTAGLDGKDGQFECTEPSAGNHGPVHVRDTYHFGYADGTMYYQFGTTCYAWMHQGDALEERTLRTLAGSPFNKIRMCVFPKRFTYNENEPVYYPFEKKEDGKWDFSRFNPDFFRHLEKRVGNLRDLGIEADLILFHPYDYGHWGFDRMDSDSDDRYLKYVVARLAAYRNVWWSMANEWNLMKKKTPADWDRFFQIVQADDPYNHPRSIHNGGAFYDHTKPWVTHASIQHWNLREAKGWRKKYGKPIIDDECQYEGDVPWPWGDLTARELVSRFWMGMVVGTYVGHGETYLDLNDILWWSKGGVLHGQSPARIAFLRKLVEEGPQVGFEPFDDSWVWDHYLGGRKTDDYMLIYFGIHRPSSFTFALPAGKKYKAEVIDPWEMTITPLEGTFREKAEIQLPGRAYLALRLRKVEQ